jgi:hypothetical protein
MAEQVTGQRPIVLFTNAIVGGVFYGAGTASETDLPESLRPFVAGEDKQPLPAPERNVYDSWSLRIQARRLEKGIAMQEAAEELANEPLRPDVQAALEAEHDLAIGRAKAQAEHSAGLYDAAYEGAQAAEPAQLFVKRGGEMTLVQRCRLKPGETVFAKIVDATGGLPPEEIIP